jgi:hypothetical protein
MNTTYSDPRRAVVAITMRKGTLTSTWTFRNGNPEPETLAAIVSAMVEGYELSDFKTVPLHKLET